MNPTQIEADLKHVMIQWMIIIAFGWMFGRLGRRVGQPLAVGEITAGLVLGPSVIGLLWPPDWQPLFPQETNHYLQFLGKLGLILLLFQVGMEFDYSHLRAHSRTVTATAAMGLIAPLLLGLAVSPWLHRTFAPQTRPFGFTLFVCIALSITALPIMGRILLEMRLERTALGALAISAAAIDDVVGWIGLAVVKLVAPVLNLNEAASFRFWWPTVANAAGVLALLLVLLWVVGPAVSKFWRWSARGRNGDGMSPTFLAVLLMALYTCCIITSTLGIFAIFGAFLFGVSLHQERGLVEAWRNRFQDFVLVAFVPIFFTNTGLRTDIGSLDRGLEWAGAAVVLGVAVAGKLGGCFLGAKLTGRSAREAGSIAALMNTRALMGLVAINIGADLGFLPRELFTMFVIMALVTTATCGPLLRWWLPADLKALVPKD